MQHPQEASSWHTNSNYVVCLSVKDENELMLLARKLETNNVKHVIFREPDFDNQATSISIEPCDKGKKLVSNLPLMFKEKQVEQKPAPSLLKRMKWSFNILKNNLEYKI